MAESSSYAYGKSSNALWINLYGGSRLATTLPNGQAIKLTQETDYPWNGRIRVTIDDCAGGAFALKLRIPGWTSGGTVRVNGLLADLSPRPCSYLEVRRDWRSGDILDLDLPMRAQWVEANPLIEETLNQVALKRGPLVYCLESTDLPHDTHLQDVSVSVGTDLLARYDGGSLGGVVLVEGSGLVKSSPDWSSQLYRPVTAAALRAVKLRFIPYYAWGNRGRSEMSVWIPLSAGQIW